MLKDKAYKRYEFRCQEVLGYNSSKQLDHGHRSVPGNHYDGATLKAALHQTQHLTGCRPQQAVFDQGFRGKLHHPENIEVVVAGTRKRKRSLRHLLKQRSAIEPVIGHTKQDPAFKQTFYVDTG